MITQGFGNTLDTIHRAHLNLGAFSYLICIRMMIWFINVEYVYVESFPMLSRWIKIDFLQLLRNFKNYRGNFLYRSLIDRLIILSYLQMFPNFPKSYHQPLGQLPSLPTSSPAPLTTVNTWIFHDSPRSASVVVVAVIKGFPALCSKMVDRFPVSVWRSLPRRVVLVSH